MLLECCILVFINIHSKNQKIQTVSDILPPVQCSYSCLNHPFLLIGYITNDTYFNIFVFTWKFDSQCSTLASCTGCRSRDLPVPGGLNGTVRNELNSTLALLDVWNSHPKLVQSISIHIVNERLHNSRVIPNFQSNDFNCYFAYF